MSYQFHTDCDPAEMDVFVVSSDQNTLFQCSDWAKVKSNWRSVFTSVSEDGTIVATALVLIRRLIPGRYMMYIPRGPVMDYTNEKLVRFYMFQLKQLAKKEHCAFIRFDPAVLSRKYPYHERSEEHERMNNDIITMLETCGARHKGFTLMIEETTQPRFNAGMDVTPDYRERLEHRTRKCIRAAEHKGIRLTEGEQEIHHLAEAMHYTEIRKQVALRGEDYFRNIMDVYGARAPCITSSLCFSEQLQKLAESIRENEEKLQGKLSKKEKAAVSQALENDRKEYEKLKADQERESQDTIITGGILAVYNDRLMELFYMGNHPDYLRMYSSYLLYARCLDICVEKGIEHCSFGGIEGTLDDGLTLFKSNWIMNVEEYIGEFNIILDNVTYRLFNEVYPKVLKRAAMLKGKAKA